MSVVRGFQPAEPVWRRGLELSPDLVKLSDRRGLLPPAGGRHGYVETSPILGFMINRGIALCFIVMLLPLFLCISLALVVTQGTSIIYRGERLGRDKKVFHIYKFRTLDAKKAALVTRDRVLPEGTNIETPIGAWLRDSRLDELPQLFNVLNGSMVLFGPRPVRPEIASRLADEIENYDVRFSVTPGLVGFSQALMSHGTSKRLRARFNNRLCRRPVNHMANLVFVVRVGLAVLRKSATKVLEALRPDAAILKRGDRDAHYIVVGGMWHRVSLNGSNSIIIDGRIGGIAKGATFRLCRPMSRGLRSTEVRVKARRWTGRRTHLHVEPVSERSQYFFERYFTEKVVLTAFG